MLAARDQENRVFGGTVAGGKNHNALNPKTPLPGGKGAPTPFKGKNVLGGRPGNENAPNLQRTVGKGKGQGLVTPLEPRTAGRAPLGNKTTNAKAMQSQMQQQQQKQQKQTQKDQKPQTSQQKAPASGRRARVLTPRTNLAKTTKLSVLSDQSASVSASASVVPDVEYCPPPVAPAKYESDVFPEGVLTFAAFKPENRLRGYYEHYFINKNNPVDETDGVPLRDKAMAERQRKAFEKLDRQVQKDLEEFDWAALREASTKAAASKATAAVKPSQPSTIALRSAASALALGSKKTIRAPSAGSAGRNAVARPKTASAELRTQSAAAAFISGLPLRKAGRPMSAMSMSAMPIRTKPSAAANFAAAESTSRTTLGYTKGRTALSMVRGGGNSSLNDAASTCFVPSTEIASLDTSSVHVPSTPVAAEDHAEDHAEEHAEQRSPAFLSIFDVDESDDDIVPHDEEVTLGMGGRSGTFGFDQDDQDDFQMDANFD